ncbi:hypothetical protein [Caldimonas brevitalea]|uniref:hypothetical protein n=1 Tax=Caldimonas brevitalea TaxID=413882 RepID=UPI0009FAE78D|nr:hypothetical protein [Caldimonas brevitalea]
MKPMLHVDFNEMVESDLVLLSAGDVKLDSRGEAILLRQGLEVMVYEDDSDERGRPDRLVATGVVERNRSTGWGAHVRWCCRIDGGGIRHESEL